MTRSRLHPRPAPRARRRAFALPLVILLVLVGGLAVVVLLDRHSGSHRAVARQVSNYINHHRAAGIMECILRWLDTARGHIEQSLDDGGLAFSMVHPRDGRIDVYLHDAQGAALTDASALSGRKREIAEDLKTILDALPESLRVEGMTRPAGPAEISINGAPPIVIQALCAAIIAKPEKAVAAANALIRARTDQKLTPADLHTALTQADLDPADLRELQAMLVISPKLYMCTAETKDSSGHLIDRSQGLYEIDDTRADTLKQSGAFLTWEQIPLE